MLLANVRIVKAMVFPTWFFNSQDLRVELQRRLSTKELMLSNCGVGEDSWESLGQQGDETSQSYGKSTLNIHRKD